MLVFTHRDPRSEMHVYKFEFGSDAIVNTIGTLNLKVNKTQCIGVG